MRVQRELLIEPETGLFIGKETVLPESREGEESIDQ